VVITANPAPPLELGASVSSSFMDFVFHDHNGNWKKDLRKGKSKHEIKEEKAKAKVERKEAKKALRVRVEQEYDHRHAPSR
jgi:hypothetical protein